MSHLIGIQSLMAKRQPLTYSCIASSLSLFLRARLVFIYITHYLSHSFLHLSFVAFNLMDPLLITISIFLLNGSFPEHLTFQLFFPVYVYQIWCIGVHFHDEFGVHFHDEFELVIYLYQIDFRKMLLRVKICSFLSSHKIEFGS